MPAVRTAGIQNENLWLPSSVEHLHQSPSEQREALISLNPRTNHRILYVGSGSGLRDVTMAFPSYFKTQRPYHAQSQHTDTVIMPPKINIFGHYQHHQEVTPVQASASDRTNTFRPSPPDPLPQSETDSSGEDDKPEYQHFPTKFRSSDQRYFYEPERTRQPLREAEADDGQHQDTEDPDQEDEPNSEDQLRRPRIRSNIGPPRAPEHFPPNGHRRENRGNLIDYLYHSYLNNLANNRLPPRVEVIPSSDRKPNLRLQEEEIDENLLTLRPPPFQDIEILTNRNPDDSEDGSHFVVPIHREPLPSPHLHQELFRQQEPVHLEHNSGKPHSHIRVQADGGLQGHDPFQPKKTVQPISFQTFDINTKPTILNTSTTSTAQPLLSNQRIASATSRRPRIYPSEDSNPRILNPIVTRQPSVPLPPGSHEKSLLSDSEYSQKLDEIQNREQKIATERQRGRLRQFEIDPKLNEFPNSPARPALQITPLTRLPEIYPFAFPDRPRFQNFLGREPQRRPNSLLPNEEEVTFKSTKVSPPGKTRPNGKPLYFKGKTGGLYASIQHILDPYHSYGTPVSHRPSSLRISPVTTLVRSHVEEQNQLRSPDLQGIHLTAMRKRLKSNSNELTLTQLAPRTISKSLRTAKIPRTQATEPDPSNEQINSSPTAQALISPASTEAASEPANPDAEKIFSTVTPTRTSLRKPNAIRNLINSRQRPKVSLTPKTKVPEVTTPAPSIEPNLTTIRPKLTTTISSKKVIIKKIRTRKPAVQSIRRPVDENSKSNSFVVKSKPTEFPLKYSSRYRNDDAQIPPTTLPTVPITGEPIIPKVLEPTPGRPFSSTPRRLVTKKTPSTPKTLSSNLPPSVLLSPKDVLRNRKPVRKLRVGSISERLKALKATATSETNLAAETEETVRVSVSSPKREINRSGPMSINNDIDLRRKIGKLNSTENEFNSQEMSDILGIPKPTPSTISLGNQETLKDDSYDDVEYEPEPQSKLLNEKEQRSPIVDFIGNSENRYLSIPIFLSNATRIQALRSKY